MTTPDSIGTIARRPGRRLQRVAVAALALFMAAGSAMAQGRSGDDHRGRSEHKERFANGHDNRRGDRDDHRHDRYDRQDGISIAVATSPVPPNGGVAAACRPNTAGATTW